MFIYLCDRHAKAYLVLVALGRGFSILRNSMTLLRTRICSWFTQRALIIDG